MNVSVVTIRDEQRVYRDRDWRFSSHIDSSCMPMPFWNTGLGPYLIKLLYHTSWKWSHEHQLDVYEWMWFHQRPPATYKRHDCHGEVLIWSTSDIHENLSYWPRWKNFEFRKKSKRVYFSTPMLESDALLPSRRMTPIINIKEVES